MFVQRGVRNGHRKATEGVRKNLIEEIVFNSTLCFYIIQMKKHTINLIPSISKQV